jgi:PAS domain S-box-containing protein
MNPSAEKLTGYALEKADGKRISDIFSLHAMKDDNAPLNPVHEIIAHGHLENNEMLLHVSGNEPIVVELSGAPIRDKAGNITGAVLALRDITARQRLEQEISKINRLESLGVLAGGIAHDFNNLLTAVLANASLLKMRSTMDEKAHRMLAMIEKAGDKAVNLTRQLLTFARGGEPIKKTASITALLGECIELTLTGSNCLCTVVHETPEVDLWPLAIDSGQISQVFNNLLINAIQAMPSGGTITVTIRNAVAPEGLPLAEGRYVSIAFRDEGEGIPEENIGKIFDPYFTTKDRGYGLGLATCYSIIKKHDGYIHVESKQGVGSTFTVYIPSTEEAAKEHVRRKAKATTSKKYRLLLMDDEEYILASLSSILESHGHECATARDGVEALNKYEEAVRQGRAFDIVIMDLTVPGGMGGKDAAREFVKLPQKPVLIVSSGYYSDPVLARPSEYGFDGVIMKPYSSDDVIASILSVMEKRPK